jgi:hypothetical protein
MSIHAAGSTHHSPTPAAADGGSSVGTRLHRRWGSPLAPVGARLGCWQQRPAT